MKGIDGFFLKIRKIRTISSFKTTATVDKVIIDVVLIGCRLAASDLLNKLTGASDGKKFELSIFYKSAIKASLLNVWVT